MSAIQKNFLHSIVIAISISLAFFWTKNSLLSSLTPQIVAVITVFYLGFSLLIKKIPGWSENKSSIDLSLTAFVVFLIIFSTGTLFSPVFFLIYFLLFAVSLLFEPSTALVLAIISSLFFLISPRKDFWPEMLQLSSVFLITPLALIFGSQYIKLLQDREQIKLLKEDERALVKEVVDQEKSVKKWTNEDFRERLIKIWNNLDVLVKDQSISDGHKEKLHEISNQLGKLLKSGTDLEKRIEK